MNTRKKKSRKAESIHSVLTHILKQYSLSPTPAPTHHTLQRLVQLWQEVAGKSISVFSTPSRFQKGTLWIEVKEAPWRRELEHLKGRYIQAMNRKMGRYLIQELRFISSSKPSVAQNQESTSQHSWGETLQNQAFSHPQKPLWLEECLSNEQKKEIEEQLRHIPDGEMKELARSIMQKRLQHAQYTQNQK